MHIEQQKLRRYSGDYSSFEAQRAQGLRLAQSQIEKQQRERAHLQSFIDRFRAKATKARQAQSRMKMLAKMEELAPLHVAAPFSFEFREPLRAPNPLLVLEDVAAGYGDKVVLRDVSLSLQAEQRIGLLGVNGAGKSTFIKTVAGVLPILGGAATLNKGLAIGYFAQHQVEMLRDDESPLWHLRALAPRHARAGAAQLPRRLQLSGRHGDAARSSTSPAARRRASRSRSSSGSGPTCCCSTSRPTTSTSRRARRSTVALAQFEGTLVLVSHDRHLLRATHRAAADRRRRHGAALRRRSRRLPRGAALAGAQAQAGTRGEAGEGAAGESRIRSRSRRGSGAWRR